MATRKRIPKKIDKDITDKADEKITDVESIDIPNEEMGGVDEMSPEDLAPDEFAGDEEDPGMPGGGEEEMGMDGIDMGMGGGEDMNGKRITTRSIVEKKKTGEKITMLTAYDYSTARLIDQAGVDIVLVGDSLGEVVLGMESTLPVTMDMMIHHASAVMRGVEHALVVGDMPFMTYQISPEEALRSAGRYMQEAGIHAVKLEGGHSVIDAVKRMIDAGIPVMGHLGYTPQSKYKIGGPRVQGRTESEAERILNDARELEAAGVFSIVLEVIPQDLAREVTAMVSVPTIGIGAGPHCDGQVLVVNDLLGLTVNGTPKHAKRYGDAGKLMSEAFKRYIEEVRAGVFPGKEQSF